MLLSLQSLTLLLILILITQSPQTQGKLEPRHALRRAARLIPRASTTNVTRATLDRIIRTYEWQQYRFQALSCRNTPSFYTNCSQVYQGEGIPNTYSIVVENYQGMQGYDYLYLYTTVVFYGFGYSNYTKYEQQFINITAQAMYYTCQSNDTCARAYNSTTGIQTSLRNLIAQNSATIKKLLPTNNTKTWIPDNYFANGLSYFSAFPSANEEIFGLHNAVVFAAHNYTQSQLQAFLALQSRLSGGAMMYESLMNHLALLSLDTGSNVTTYTKREIKTTYMTDGTYDKLRLKREALMKELAKLRGPARSRIAELNMRSNYQFLGLHAESISHPNRSSNVTKNYLISRAACANTATAQTYASEVAQYINDACGIAAPALSIYNIGKTYAEWCNGPFAPIATQLGKSTEFFFNHLVAQVSFVNGLCDLIGGNAPCFPDATFWSTASNVGTIVGLLEDAWGVYSLVAAGQAVPAAAMAIGVIDVGCAIAGLAHDTYVAAAACCAKNCNAPACVAAGIACSVAGPQC